MLEQLLWLHLQGMGESGDGPQGQVGFPEFRSLQVAHRHVQSLSELCLREPHRHPEFRNPRANPRLQHLPATTLGRRLRSAGRAEVGGCGHPQLFPALPSPIYGAISTFYSTKGERLTDEHNTDEQTQGKLAAAISQVLDAAYERALEGAPGLDSVDALAASYQKEGATPAEQAESLVRWQMGKAGAVGFVTGLPGLAAMPVSIPANLATVLMLQLRMAAAIAKLGGHNPDDDQVKAFALMCLAGSGVNELAREFGIKLSTKLAQKAVERVSGKALIEINKRVGFRLATKFGEKGIVNLGKAVPFVGGVVGAVFDAGTTRMVGTAAIEAFLSEGPPPVTPLNSSSSASADEPEEEN